MGYEAQQRSKAQETEDEHEYAGEDSECEERHDAVFTPVQDGDVEYDQREGARRLH